MGGKSDDSIQDTIREAGTNEHLVTMRSLLAQMAAEVFTNTGRELQVSGHVIGEGRLAGRSPTENGDDEAVGVAYLLRIAGELLSVTAQLFESGRCYAAAALTRQMVEVQYLAWAFDTRDNDAARWLRSDRNEREQFFSPSKLRKASEGRFPAKDYSQHCEMGGHPIPRGARALLDAEPHRRQLMLADLLQHVAGVWQHVVGWARRNAHGDIVLKHETQLSQNFSTWLSYDPLVRLPPAAPPE